jgi:RNA polymerase sigma-70 factor (ECF subfamily)
MPERPDLADRELMERTRTDPDAFGLFFDRHFDEIFGYAFRRTGDYDIARDIASEVFLKALRGLWRYRWTGVPVAAWLYAIATNEIRMHFRRGRRKHVSLEALALAPADPRALDVERLEAEEIEHRHSEFARVRRALGHLPSRYQDVLALRFFEQKSVAEIAQILGQRAGTVKSLLSRGLSRLRRELVEPQPDARSRIGINEGRSPLG